MKLSYDQIAASAMGITYTSEAPNGLHFHRFTREQEALYARRGHPMPLRIGANAGVALQFRTDSPTLQLEGSFCEGWSREYNSIDVKADGIYIGSIDNYSHLPIPAGGYPELRCPRGDFAGGFDLGQGEKLVKIYLPWDADTAVRTVALADGSSFCPVRPQRKILFFGDSITQGYDALRPMNSYASRVADALGMEQVNKAIGGECFDAELTSLAEDMDPAIVVVSWGTNNWGIHPREFLLNHAPKAFRDLRDKYPQAAMYAILPIWRGDRDEIRQYGAFAQMREDVRQAAEAVEGITVVDGYDLVPHDPAYFADLRLHPNDEGFRLYAENLLKILK